jgi:hypothetical protein
MSQDEPRTCKGWLYWLSEQAPTDEDWKDPVWVERASWVMLMFLGRRMNQRLIDSGFASDGRGQCFLD